MITLNHFNQLPQAQALRLLEPCVALPAWREALALERPYATLTALTDRAQQLMQHWGEADLARALCAHPRIGKSRRAGKRMPRCLARSRRRLMPTMPISPGR